MEKGAQVRKVRSDGTNAANDFSAGTPAGPTTTSLGSSQAIQPRRRAARPTRRAVRLAGPGGSPVGVLSGCGQAGGFRAYILCNPVVSGCQPVCGVTQVVEL